MNKVLRIIGILIASLFALIVIAALILPQIIDLNNYRDKIAALVERETGRELVIAGDIGWSVFPWLGVEVGQMRLANAPGFGDEPFAQVEELQVHVRLLPLLNKEVEMSTLVLDGLHLNLAKNKQGQTNWEDLLKRQDQPQSAPTEKADAELPIAALAIGGVQVRKAQVVWHDRGAGTTQRIENLNLTLGEVRPGRPVDLMLNFIAKTGEPEMVAQIRSMGRVSVSESLQQIKIPTFEVSMDAEGGNLPGGRLNFNLRSNLSLDLEQQTLKADDLLITLMDLVMLGQMQGQGVGGDKPRFNGDIRIKDFVPRELLRSLGQSIPEVSDGSVLDRAGGSFNFQATADSINLKDMKFTLDDSTLSGTAAVSNFSAPAIRFDIALDSIDLDRYLPPRKEGDTKVAPTPAEAAAGGAAALPVETLRGLNLEGTAKIGKLKAYQMRSSDVTVTISAKQGLVRVHPASARLYEGRYSGNVTLDARGDTPRISLDEKISGVQIGPLFEDLHGKTKLTGTTEVAVKLDAAGQTSEAMRKNLNGNASFSLTEGTIKGMDVLSEIRKAYALFKSKPVPDSKANQTDFSSLTGTATIADGVVNNNDLLMKSALMQAQGEGTVNLVSEALDYRVTATLVDALEGKGELTGRPIPVRISGTISNPKVGVDMEQALKEEVKKQIEKQIEKKLGGPLEEKQQEVEQDLQKKLEDKVQDKLKGLFGQ